MLEDALRVGVRLKPPQKRRQAQAENDAVNEMTAQLEGQAA